MVSPLKAPSSGGKTAGRKPESAAPGPSEFAASLQGLFTVLDRPPVRLREEASGSVREPAASRPVEIAGRISPAAEFEPASESESSAAAAAEPVEGSAPAPAIERALGALEEIRRREGLQPAPAAPSSPEKSEAETSSPPNAPTPSAAAEPEPPPAGLPAPPPAVSAEEEEVLQEIKDIQILPAGMDGDAGVEASASSPEAGSSAALPAWVPVRVESKSVPLRPEGNSDEGVSGVAGVAAAPGALNSSPRMSSRGPEPATPAETVDRIVQAAQLLKTRGATRLRLRLNPPNLGGLRVDLSVRQGVLQGRLLADNVAARDLLLAQMDQLKAALEAQGLQVGEFQVGVDQSFQQASEDPSWTDGSFGTGSRESSEEDGAAAAVPEPPDRRAHEQQFFDVTI